MKIGRIIILSATFVSEGALSQSAFGDDASYGGAEIEGENVEDFTLDDGDLNTEEGIEAATPSDDLDELDQGNLQNQGYNNLNLQQAIDNQEYDSEPLQQTQDEDVGGATIPSASGGVSSGDETLDSEAPTSEESPVEVLQEVIQDPVVEAIPPEQAPPAISIDDAQVPEAPPLPPPNEFAGAPPVPGSLRNMADGEAPEEYVVEFGDTLFDICDQLLDEGGYWPKLWSLNPEIKNPHFIFPGMRLRFYPGDDETPPYLQVVAEDDVIPIDKGDLDEALLIEEPVDIVRSVIDEASDAIEVIGSEDVGGDGYDALLLAGGRYTGTELTVTVPGFIYSEEREPLAYVLGGANGEFSASERREVLLEGDQGGLNIGSTYSILRPGEEIENPESGVFVGYKYYYVGNLSVTKDVGEDVYRAIVTKSRLSAYPDDIIVDFISTNRQIPSAEGTGSLTETEANVVGFQHRGQIMGGAGQYAFIDRGSGDGVSPGMFVPVFSKPGYASSVFASDLPEDYSYVGVIRIIDATDAGAVGYIVRNERELRVGDRAGNG